MAITKRGKTWQARFWWKDVQGKKHSKTKDGFKTKAEAANWMSEIRVKHNSGLVIDQNPVFAEYFWNWYKTYREGSLRPGSKDRYKSAYKYLKKFWGNRKIKDINRVQWQQFLNGFSKHLSTATIRGFLQVYRACVRYAIADGLVSNDFTFGSKIAGNDSNTRKNKVEFLSISETKKLFNKALEVRSPKSTITYMIITAILTGARISEIKALKWHNINYSNQTIDIHHNYDEKRHVLAPTKNESSYRTIKVTQQLLDILNELKVNHADYIFEGPKYHIPPTIYCTNVALKKMLKKVGLEKPGFTFHSLRHCHVAILLYQNVDIYAISERLGHKNLNVTLSTYAYMIKEKKKETDQNTIDKLDELFDSRNTSGTQL